MGSQGSGAACLGFVWYESGHESRGANLVAGPPPKTIDEVAVWATAAWLQHRSIVAWKQDLGASLRKAQACLRKG